MPIFVYFSERWCKQRALAGLGNLYNLFLYLRVFFLKKFVFKKIIQARTSKDFAFFFVKLFHTRVFFSINVFQRDDSETDLRGPGMFVLYAVFAYFFILFIFFQGDDPVTDLRGLGMLSIRLLYFFAQRYLTKKKKFFSKTSLFFWLFFSSSGACICVFVNGMYLYMYICLYVYMCMYVYVQIYTRFMYTYTHTGHWCSLMG